MHLRGLDNLCSSAVYNQEQLTLNTISCGLQSKVAKNRVKLSHKFWTNSLEIFSLSSQCHKTTILRIAFKNEKI